MSSAKDLVQGSCGTSNPLMKATSHFASDQAYRSSNPENGEDFTAEFLQQNQLVPRQHSFQMSHLLKEINQASSQNLSTLSRATNQLYPVGPQTNYAHQQWVEQFHQFQPNATNPQFQPSPRSISHLKPYSPSHWTPFNQTLFMQPREHFGASNLQIPHQEKSMEEAWKSATKSEVKNDYSEAAAKAVDSLKDDEVISETNFFKYLESISRSIPNQKPTKEKIEEVKDDFDKFKESQMPKNDEDWASQFEENQALKNSFWDNFERTWASEVSESNYPWSQEFEDQENSIYAYSSENPFEGMQDSFEEGIRRMKIGDLSNAVLLFEADVQQNPEHADGWYYLGQAHAQNEQELNAIKALTRALDLEPNKLGALMALAVSQTNESMHHKAVETLRKWIRANPSYSHLVSGMEGINVESSDPLTSTLSKGSFFKSLETAFINAARMRPSNPDADIQSGLGILFHISEDFDKAVDCFQAAIAVRPNDALLWNKLGATLANGSRSEEAVEAYRRALELNPGFIRSRYNLGISCISLQAHREAIEHFLTALDCQRSAVGPNGKVGQMSSAIWNTLSMTISIMKDNHAWDLANNRDLNGLMRYFSIQPTS